MVVLNWLLGAAILALLVALPNERWIMSAFELSPGPVADRIIMGLRAVAVIGLVTIPLNYMILKRLLAMADTVRAGDPFVAENDDRLQRIAWSVLGLELLHVAVMTIAAAVSTEATPIDIKWRLNVARLVTVLLLFVLARVFEQGTRLREDLEGTV